MEDELMAADLLFQELLLSLLMIAAPEYSPLVIIWHSPRAFPIRV